MNPNNVINLSGVAFQKKQPHVVQISALSMGFGLFHFVTNSMYLFFIPFLMGKNLTMVCKSNEKQLKAVLLKDGY